MKFKFEIPKRQKKLTTEKAAKEFARTARPGVVYYQAHTYSNPAIGRWTILREIVFQPPTLSSRLISGPVPRWYGPLTAEDCWLQQGPLYSNRNHADIRNLPTLEEHRIEVARNAAKLAPNAVDLDAAVVGTRFRSIW